MSPDGTATHPGPVRTRHQMAWISGMQMRTFVSVSKAWIPCMGKRTDTNARVRPDSAKW